jgi:hypothetical protein
MRVTSKRDPHPCLLFRTESFTKERLEWSRRALEQEQLAFCCHHGTVMHSDILAMLINKGRKASMAHCKLERDICQPYQQVKRSKGECCTNFENWFIVEELPPVFPVCVDSNVSGQIFRQPLATVHCRSRMGCGSLETNRADNWARAGPLSRLD